MLSVLINDLLVVYFVATARISQHDRKSLEMLFIYSFIFQLFFFLYEQKLSSLVK